MKKFKSLFATALLFALIFSTFSIIGNDVYAASKPSRVKNLKAVSVSYNSITLTWKKASGAKKYVVYRAASKNGKYKKIATTGKLRYVNEKLKFDKKYWYKVRAMKGNVKGPFSKKAGVKTKLGKIKNIRQTSRTHESVTVRWDPVPGATEYNYGWSYNKKNWHFDEVVTVPGEGSYRRGYATKKTQCRIRDLKPNRTVYVSISAYRKGNVDNCSESTVRTTTGPIPNTKYDYKIYLMNPNKPLVDITWNGEALIYVKTNNPDPSSLGIGAVDQSEVYSFDPENYIKEYNLRFGFNASKVVSLREIDDNGKPVLNFGIDPLETDGFKVPGGYFFVEMSPNIGTNIFTIWEKQDDCWIKAATLKYNCLDGEPLEQKYADELAYKYFGSDYSFSWESLYKLCDEVREAATYPHLDLPSGSTLLCPLQAYDTPWGPTHVMDSMQSPRILARILNHCSGVTYENSADSHGYDYHAYLDVTYNGETHELISFCPIPQDYKKQTMKLP